MDENTKNILEEFHRACRPAVEFLQKYYNPMCKIIISDSLCEIVESALGIPNEVDFEQL